MAQADPYSGCGSTRGDGGNHCHGFARDHDGNRPKDRANDLIQSYDEQRILHRRRDHSCDP